MKPVGLSQLTVDNKQYYARKFAERLINDMDLEEITDTAKEYFYRDKMREPLDILEQEIFKSYPELLKYPHLEKEAHNA